MASSHSIEKQILVHKDAVYRQMIRVCDQREDAEDALAAAILIALKSHDQMRDDASFRAWLATIGKRVCYRMRSKPQFQSLLDEIDKIAESNVIDPMEFSILKGCVIEALDALPPKYREVYERCELNQWSPQQAANELGLTLPATKSRLLRAREMIRRKLDTSLCGPI